MTKYISISGIYIILHIKTGKVYIGQSQDIHTRWLTHKSLLSNNRHHSIHLQRAWNKYGEKAFQFKKLEYCPIDKLDEREQHYLNIYIAKGLCFNIASNVQNPMRGRKHSEETRRKLSDAQKGNKKMLGRTHSEETRRKISNAVKGKKRSEATRHKISEAGKRRPPISEETRRKLSEIRKGRTRPPFSDEHRRKISEAAKRREALKRSAKDE
jgi:Straboviridae intron-associated endonuclease 1